MEDSRAEARVSNATEFESAVENEEKVRVPRKRFIGRRAALERSENNVKLNGAIEENGVIDGLRNQSYFKGND